MKIDFDKDNGSIIKFKKEHPEISLDWALEVFVSSIQYSDDSMHYFIYTVIKYALSGIPVAEITLKASSPCAAIWLRLSIVEALLAVTDSIIALSVNSIYARLVAAGIGPGYKPIWRLSHRRGLSLRCWRYAVPKTSSLNIKPVKTRATMANMEHAVTVPSNQL